MDGGLPKWIASGYPVAKGPQRPIPVVSYTSTFNPALLRNLEQVKEAIGQKKEQVMGLKEGWVNGSRKGG